MSMQPETRNRRLDLDYATGDRAVARFFNTAYAWMAVGLALTALVGWFVSHTPALQRLVFAGPMGITAVALGAFAIAWYVQSNAARLSVGTSTALYLLYCTIIGVMVSYIFIVYDAKTLAGAFLMSGGVFGGMSLYGFVTKRDLTRFSSILVMAVLGLFLASLVNLFWANDLMSWIITYAVLAVFIGLTAVQTQNLKRIAEQYRDQPELAAKFAIVGSLVLYIAFINIFLSILRIMGNRR